MKKAKLKLHDGEGEDDGTDNDVNKQSFVCSFRFGLAILGFLIILHNNMQRVNMSVAILCMVNHTAVRMLAEEQLLENNDTKMMTQDLNMTLDKSSSCSGSGNDSEVLMKDGPFVWDKPTQGHILGAYFYGYFISNFPSGMIAERFGPKWPLFIMYTIATVATLLTPIAATVSPIFLIILRIIIGIGSGAMFPSFHTLWGRWAPPLERSKLTGISYAGAMAAAMIGLPLSGLLCKYGFGEGWDSIFYIIGASSSVMMIMLVVFVTNSPSENKRLSASEKRYILHSLKGQVSEEKTDKITLPWKTVLSSGPVWAIIAANFCSDWGLYTLLTNIPTFLSEVLEFNIQSNGVFSALPFLGLWINMNVSPIIADKLRASGVMSTTVTRKVFNSIGMFVPALFLSCLGFVECSQAYIGIALLVVAVTFSGCAYTGFLVNHIDLAPKYAGTLLGISNTIGAATGFIAPSIAAALTTDQSRSSWQIVFFISAGVYMVGGIIYIIFGSGRLQPWAMEEKEPEIVELKNGAIIESPSNGCVILDDVKPDLNGENDKVTNDVVA